MATEIRALLDEGAARLGRVADEPRREAEVLLGAALGRTRAWLLAHPEERILDCEATDRYEAHVTRRGSGEPVAYLLGEKEFWSLPLAVGPGVLIPRPETELLVERALAHLPADRPCAVLDLATGSGAVALAIARERPLARVVATDVVEPRRWTRRGSTPRDSALGSTRRVRRGLVVRPPVAAHVRPHRQQSALHRGGRPARRAGGAPLRAAAGAVRRTRPGSRRCAQSSRARRAPRARRLAGGRARRRRRARPCGQLFVAAGFETCGPIATSRAATAAPKGGLPLWRTGPDTFHECPLFKVRDGLDRPRPCENAVANGSIARTGEATRASVTPASPRSAAARRGSASLASGCMPGPASSSPFALSATSSSGSASLPSTI